MTLAIACSLPAQAAAQRTATPLAASQALVFDGVTVVDVEQGTLIRAQRVVIVGRHIQAMGDTDAIKNPQDAQVVDARGKYLIPGLWDLHVHPGVSTDVYYPLFLANGITGIRDAWSPVPLDTLRQWQREILAGTRVGPPRQLLSGPMIQTSCPIDEGCVALGQGEDGVSVAARAQQIADSLKAAGADMLKVRDLYPAATYFLVAAAARRAGLPLGGHTWDSIDVAASDSGARIIDHFQPWYDVPAGLRVWCWAAKPTASAEKCRAVAERFQRNRTWVVPTMAIYVGRRSAQTRHSYALAEQLRRRSDEFFGGTLLRGNWLRDSLPAETGPPPEDLFAVTEVLPDSLRVLQLIEQAGLPIAAGTDVNPGFFHSIPPGFSLHAELAVYVSEGLTPRRALQSATLEPAKLIGATDSLGTVAVGKLADLVLLEANPLDDITNTTMIRAVVANGRYYDRNALDQLLIDARKRAEEEGL